MSDDSETVEDTEKGSLAEVTDDSCTVEFIENGPSDGTSDDYHTLEFEYPIIEIRPEDLNNVKQEPADENDDQGPNYSLKDEPVDENGAEFLDYSVKQEPPDEYETEPPLFTAEVSSQFYIYVIDFCNSSLWM